MLKYHISKFPHLFRINAPLLLMHVFLAYHGVFRPSERSRSQYPAGLHYVQRVAELEAQSDELKQPGGPRRRCKKTSGTGVSIDSDDELWTLRDDI